MQALCGQDTNTVRPAAAAAGGWACEDAGALTVPGGTRDKASAGPRLSPRVDLKTAKTPGLSIPESFLLLAD